MPANTTFVSATAPAGWTLTTPKVGDTGTVTATNASLGSGASAEFTLVVNVGSEVAGGSIITNTAAVTSTTPDPVPANNSDTETTTVNTQADLSVTKTDSPDPVISGENLSYSITVNNNGPSVAATVSLSDMVPANTTFVSFTAPAGWTATTPAVGGTGSISATNPLLAAGASDVFTLVVNVNPGLAEGTAISNTASVSAATADATPANNSATETTTVTGVPSQALNVSTRMRVRTGDGVGIGGFIISGEAPKTVLVRAIGPSLFRFGLSGLLTDPTLALHGPSGFVSVFNDNWQDTQGPAIAATGLPPVHDDESAILATLPPGAYTAIVAGVNNTVGIALVEVYDLDTAAASRLTNISTRAFCDLGDNLVIAGFILGSDSLGAEGNGGGTSGNVDLIIRGIGPSMAAFGVPDLLADPAIDLRDAQGTLLLANNNWQDVPAQAAAISAAGLAPGDPSEAGIAVSLPPGLYTVLLTDQGGGTGNGLVEVYDVEDVIPDK